MIKSMLFFSACNYKIYAYFLINVSGTIHQNQCAIEHLVLAVCHSLPACASEQGNVIVSVRI